MKYLKKALEDTGVPNEIAPMDPEVTQTLDNLQDAQDHSDDIVEMVVSLEEEYEAVSELEDVEDILGETLKKDDPVTFVAAESINLYMNSILSRMVLTPKPKKTFPSTESFKKSSSRTMLKYALESIGETVKKAWEAIKKFVSEIWEKIKNFFAKFFQNTEKLTKRAKDLKAAILNRTAGKTLKNKELKNSGVAKCFGLDGEAGYDTTLKILERHISATVMFGDIPKLFSEYVKQVGVSIREAEKLVESRRKKAAELRKRNSSYSDDKADKNDELANSAEENALNASIQKANDQLIRSVQKVKDIGFGDARLNPDSYKKEDWDTEGFKTEPFGFGNFLVLLVHTKKEPDGSGNNAKNFTIDKVNTKDVSNYKDPGETLKTLQAREMETICDKTLALSETTDVFKKKQSQYNDLINSVLQCADSAIKLADAIAQDEELMKFKSLDYIRSAKQTIPQVQSGVTKLMTWMPVYNVKVGHKALDYVQASIHAYE